MKRNYKRDYEFQKKLNIKLEKEIELLKLENQELKVQCNKKDEIINSVDSLRVEMTQHTNAIKDKRKEYDKLVEDLRKMRKVMNKEFFKGRWRLVKFLIK
jgi:chromosome segregation ATPase